MSQIANAYVLTPRQLDQLSDLVAGRRWDDAWGLLVDEARSVKPGYDYAGDTLAILLPFLHEEHGVSLPSHDEEPSIKAIFDSELGMVGCLTAEDARTLAAGLETVRASEDELARYYASVEEEGAEHPGLAMRAALDFLRRCTQQAIGPDERLILFVG